MEHGQALPLAGEHGWQASVARRWKASNVRPAPPLIQLHMAGEQGPALTP